MAEPHKPTAHTPLEDAQAAILGTALCALGVQFLGHAQLVTGQTAGLGVLLSYTTGWSFGVWFFVLNLPFYVLALMRMGVSFTLKSFAAVLLVSLQSELFATLIVLDTVPPWLASLLAGGLIGMGLIIVFRHGASLGGIGVLALYLQDKTGFKAGYTQLIFDGVLFGFALLFLPWTVVAWSLLGAVVTNLIIATNHRKDRYVAR
ncbi:YitT family protein [Tateyamaria sp. SN6-1]|uniref:YitT family protein n=1 Tax=Tateyamaria sp. SN6-1 TaxID=3092148 RepID=UPI0039F5823A